MRRRRRRHAAQPLTPAPDFALSDAAGRPVRLSPLRGSTVVLCFRTIDCPVGNDYDGRLSDFARRFVGRGAAPGGGSAGPPPPRVSVLSINVGPGRPAAVAAGVRCLLDPAGEVAERYAVEVTPTFFVIDASGKIRYRGCFDDNRNAAQADARYCQDALECLLHGNPVRQPLTAAFGCALGKQGKQVRLSLAR